MARETQLNNIIRSVSDSNSPHDRATADLPYAVEAALETFEKAGVPFPQEPHEVKRILRQGATAVLREYQRLKDAQVERTPEHLEAGAVPPGPVAPSLARQRQQLLQTLASLVELKREELVDEVEHLLREGLIIQAIKRYRDLSGSGLKEAKAAVEAIEARLRSRRVLPDETAPRPSAWRSWTWLLIAAVLGGLGLLFLLGGRT